MRYGYARDIARARAVIDGAPVADAASMPNDAPTPAACRGRAMLRAAPCDMMMLRAMSPDAAAAFDTTPRRRYYFFSDA